MIIALIHSRLATLIFVAVIVSIGVINIDEIERLLKALGNLLPEMP